MTERCSACGHHRDWGCAFSCPERKAPRDHQQYSAWAQAQKDHYARGEAPGERRKEAA